VLYKFTDTCMTAQSCMKFKIRVYWQDWLINCKINTVVMLDVHLAKNVLSMSNAKTSKENKQCLSSYRSELY